VEGNSGFSPSNLFPFSSTPSGDPWFSIMIFSAYSIIGVSSDRSLAVNLTGELSFGFELDDFKSAEAAD